jgi:hypothetical protein
MADLAAAMPGLRTLLLNRCSLLTDEAAVAIATLRHLRELRLSRVTQLRDRGVRPPFLRLIPHYPLLCVCALYIRSWYNDFPWQNFDILLRYA